MAVTYEPIASQSLTSNAATVTFSSIPATYTDLVLVSSIRSARTAGEDYGPEFRLNSDTATNYSSTTVAGNGSSATSFRASSRGEMPMGNDVPSTTAASNLFMPHLFYLFSYANTNVFKTALSASNGLTDLNRTVGLWRSTSAVNSISVKLFFSDFLSGSTFSLYGIKAA